MARKRFVTSDMSIDEKIADIAAENPTAALMWPWFITGFDDWGTLIFKWSEVQIPLSKVLDAIGDYEPLFGHRSGKNMNTHWMAFMKV